jgi:hypothetical protein
MSGVHGVLALFPLRGGRGGGVTHVGCWQAMLDKLYMDQVEEDAVL